MATYVTFPQGHTESSVKCAQGKRALNYVIGPQTFSEGLSL